MSNTVILVIVLIANAVPAYCWFKYWQACRRRGGRKQ